MNWNRKPPPASEDDEISFPRLACWNPMTKVATIAAEVNGRRVLCKISVELLKERFHASAEEPMRAVAENRLAIEAAARNLIERVAYEEDGSILIRDRNI